MATEDNLMCYISGTNKSIPKVTHVSKKELLLQVEGKEKKVDVYPSSMFSNRLQRLVNKNPPIRVSVCILAPSHFLEMVVLGWRHLAASGIEVVGNPTSDLSSHPDIVYILKSENEESLLNELSRLDKPIILIGISNFSSLFEYDVYQPQIAHPKILVPSREESRSFCFADFVQKVFPS